MSVLNRAEWLAIAKDRTAIMLLIGLTAACIILLALTVIRIQPSDIQVPVRYTGYGQTFIYRDQWYVQASYVLFALIVAGVNGFLAIKLIQTRRLLGLGVLGMTIFVVVFASIVANSIFNLAPTL